MSDIVERLNGIWANDDHDRGCQGREYSCSCGFDNRTAKTAEDAASEIVRLRQLLSEAEKREREARAKALEDADQICAKALSEGSPIHPIAVKYITGIRNALSALQSEER